MPVVTPEIPHRPDEEDDEILDETFPMDFPPEDINLRKEFIFKRKEAGNRRSAENLRHSQNTIRHSARPSYM